MENREQVLKLCREVIAPLIHADGGDMYLVELTANEIHLHLGGTCAGCPGATMTREGVIQPAISSIAPKLTVRLTTGWQVPNGAQKIEAG